MRYVSLLLTVIFTTSYTQAQNTATAPASGATARTARAFEEAKKQSPLALRDFLVGMPKGADLHVHLAGAIYAESFIRAAGEDGLCIDAKALSFTKPSAGACSSDQGQIRTSEMLANMQAPANQDLYDKLINSFSMRSFVP